jgi:hypothetical protein
MKDEIMLSTFSKTSGTVPRRSHAEQQWQRGMTYKIKFFKIYILKTLVIHVSLSEDPS